MNRLFKYVTPLVVVAGSGLLLGILEAIYRDIDGWWIGGEFILFIFIILPCLCANVLINSAKISRKSKMKYQLAGVGIYFILFIYFYI